MLELLLFLPLLVLAGLFAAFAYRSSPYSTPTKAALVVAFFLFMPVSFWYRSTLMEEAIAPDAQKALQEYLRHFRLTYIDKPYGARQMRFSTLHNADNRAYIRQQYREYSSDGIITYNELMRLSSSTINIGRLER